MSDPQSLPRLGARGLALWRDVTAAAALKPAELEILLEACRIADRLETLDELLSGGAESWARIQLPRDEDGELVLVVSGALSEARQQQNIFKQLIASLRLPDEQSGARPQQRGGGRGAYQPKGAGSGTVTALERARRKAGA
jgi:hypothetical protein